MMNRRNGKNSWSKQVRNADEVEEKMEKKLRR